MDFSLQVSDLNLMNLDLNFTKRIYTNSLDVDLWILVSEFQKFKFHEKDLCHIVVGGSLFSALPKLSANSAHLGI